MYIRQETTSLLDKYFKTLVRAKVFWMGVPEPRQPEQLTRGTTNQSAPAHLKEQPEKRDDGPPQSEKLPSNHSAK